MNEEISAEDKVKARERFHIIMQVESGLITATEGAKLLGVSRVTFYEWQNSALSSTLTALTDGKVGRPKLSSQELKIRRLEKELRQVKNELYEEKVLGQFREEVIAIRESQIDESKKKIR